MNKWKWGAIAASIILAMIGSCKYGQWTILRQTGSDTTVIRNQAIVVTIPVPVVVQDKDTVWKKRDVITLHDTLEMEVDGPVVYLPTETPQALIDAANDWRATRQYDTTFTRAGDTLRVMSVVSRNKMQHQVVEAYWGDTAIRTTTILRPPRNIVGYYTVSVLGDRRSFDGVGFGLALKNRRDIVYHLEYKRIFGPNNKGALEARLMLPIRLTNKNK